MKKQLRIGHDHSSCAEVVNLVRAEPQAEVKSPSSLDLPRANRPRPSNYGRITAAVAGVEVRVAVVA